MLASNPPYVAANDPVLIEDGLRHEPRAALTPRSAMDSRPWPLLLMEPPGICGPAAGWRSNTAHAQGETVRALLVARGFTHVTSHRDLAGHERVTEGNLAP